ncbi:MAG: hypothetical protein H7836_07655, partial [Magnetococcus sp. YQC-3]
MAMMDLEVTKTAAQPLPKSNISEAIVRLHRRGAFVHLTQLLSKLKPADIADVLNGFPEQKAQEIFLMISPSTHAAAVVEALDDSHKQSILTQIPLEQAVSILQCLPLDLRQRTINALGDSTAERFRDALEQANQVSNALSEETESYADDTAGSLMETNILVLPETMTAAEAIVAVQEMSSLNSIFYLYV